MEKFEATNREFLNLYKGLEGVKSIKGARFAVLVGKNMRELRNLLDPIEAAAVPSIEFQELSVEMQKLIEAEDQDGMSKLEADNTFDFEMGITFYQNFPKKSSAKEGDGKKAEDGEQKEKTDKSETEPSEKKKSADEK